jgi:chromosomal replication initiator protein
MSVDLWQRGCERLATELPEQQFNTWIRPLAPANLPLPVDGSGVGVLSLQVQSWTGFARNTPAALKRR